MWNPQKDSIKHWNEMNKTSVFKTFPLLLINIPIYLKECMAKFTFTGVAQGAYVVQQTHFPSAGITIRTNNCIRCSFPVPLCSCLKVVPMNFYTLWLFLPSITETLQWFGTNCLSRIAFNWSKRTFRSTCFKDLQVFNYDRKYFRKNT